MNEHILKLENGLRVCLLPNKNVESVVVYLKGLAGSNCESMENIGVAHLLEHMIFEGSDGHNLITKEGGKYIGVTSRNDVLYGVHLLKDRLNNGCEFLSKIFYEPNVQIKNLETTKQTVVAEIKRYRDIPEKLIGRLAYATNFPNTRLEKFNTGDVEDVKKINIRELVKFHSDYYTNGNFVIVISGNFYQNEALEILNKHFWLKTNKSPTPVKITPTSQTNVKNHQLNFEQDYLRLDFNGINSNDATKYSAQVLAKCLSALVAQTTRQEGISYKTSVDSFATDDYGIFSFFGTSPVDRTKQLLSTYIKSTKNINFEFVESSKKSILSSITFALEKPSMMAEYYSDAILHNKNPLTHMEYIDALKKITYEEVVAIKNYILSQNPKLTLISSENRALEIDNHLYNLLN